METSLYCACNQERGIYWSSNHTVTAAAQVLARPYAILLAMFLPANLLRGVSIDLPTYCKYTRPIHHSLDRLALRAYHYSIRAPGKVPPCLHIHYTPWIQLFHYHLDYYKGYTNRLSSFTTHAQNRVLTE